MVQSLFLDHPTIKSQCLLVSHPSFGEPRPFGRRPTTSHDTGVGEKLSDRIFEEIFHNLRCGEKLLDTSGHCNGHHGHRFLCFFLGGDANWPLLIMGKLFCHGILGSTLLSDEQVPMFRFAGEILIRVAPFCSVLSKQRLKLCG